MMHDFLPWYVAVPGGLGIVVFLLLEDGQRRARHHLNKLANYIGVTR